MALPILIALAMMRETCLKNFNGERGAPEEMNTKAEDELVRVGDLLSFSDSYGRIHVLMALRGLIAQGDWWRGGSGSRSPQALESILRGLRTRYGASLARLGNLPPQSSFVVFGKRSVPYK